MAKKKAKKTARKTTSIAGAKKKAPRSPSPAKPPLSPLSLSLSNKTRLLIPREGRQLPARFSIDDLKDAGAFLQIRPNYEWIDASDDIILSDHAVLENTSVVEIAPTIALLPAPPAVASAQAMSALQQRLGTKLSAVDDPLLTALGPLPLEIDTNLDPRLQVAIANRQTGKRSPSFASTTADEVAVVARVSDVEAWNELADVLPGATMGRAEDDGWIVTGRIPVDRIEAIRAEPIILSLKAAQVVQPMLSATIDNLGVAPTSMPAHVKPDGGAGVVVGIIDFGCDFAHGNFRHADGRTRLSGIWDQAGVKRAGSPVAYGRFIGPDEINTALTSANPYGALGYSPEAEAHGTHVMDIAAGNGLGSGQAGVAPKAELYFVELASTDIPWGGVETVKSSFGDSVQLLEAVRFVFDRAGDRPCVVNMSLGTNGGPHDGSTLVEQGLDTIVREKANRAIIIAAANSQQHGIHTMGVVPGAAQHDIAWRIRNQGGGEFELWYPGAAHLEVTLIGEDGTSFGPVAAGDNLPIGTPGNVAIMIASRLSDPNNHDNMIGIWLAPNLAGRQWTVRLRSQNGDNVAYHAWIERNDYAQASFATPVPSHTIGSISTGQKTIVVGSYDAHKTTMPISSFSSAGPTRDGRQKPEVSAPGQNVEAAASRTRVGITRMSGTSMAAPAVSGLVALMLADAKRKGQNLTIDDIRNKLMTHVRRNPPTSNPGWDGRYGFGRVSKDAL